MNQSPDPFDKELSAERVKATKKQANKWFVVLLVSGLIIGAIASIVIVKVLDNFGLTDQPDRPFFEQIQE